MSDHDRGEERTTMAGGPPRGQRLTRNRGTAATVQPSYPESPRLSQERPRLSLGLPALSWDELFRFLFNNRAFANAERGTPRTDPRGIGRGVGPDWTRRGREVFVVIQIVDRDGNQVAIGQGHHLLEERIWGTEHAEEVALRNLDRSLPEGMTWPGGQLMVAVDQRPCGAEDHNCKEQLRTFARRRRLELFVHVPLRRHMRSPHIEVRPRTASRGAFRTDTPPIYYEEFDHVPAPASGGGDTQASPRPQRSSPESGREGGAAPARRRPSSREVSGSEGRRRTRAPSVDGSSQRGRPLRGLALNLTANALTILLTSWMYEQMRGNLQRTPRLTPDIRSGRAFTQYIRRVRPRLSIHGLLRTHIHEAKRIFMDEHTAFLNAAFWNALAIDRLRNAQERQDRFIFLSSDLQSDYRTLLEMKNNIHRALTLEGDFRSRIQAAIRLKSYLENIFAADQLILLGMPFDDYLECVINLRIYAAALRNTLNDLHNLRQAVQSGMERTTRMQKLLDTAAERGHLAVPSGWPNQSR